MIITIDGPSGTGKSTVARKVAEQLGFTHVDTGAIYRAFTWYVLEQQLSATDKEKVIGLLPSFRYTAKGGRHFVNQHEVTELIREQRVTAAVSAVAAIKEVREAMTPLQREVAKDCVVEGRDLGTTIFPDADYKFYLTARPEVRAQRRLGEIEKKYSLDFILRDQQRRDAYDSSREVSPLRRPEDAIEIDTSDLTIDQVVAKILEVIQ